ncbi:hypothetical protein GF406_09945 [candidate division KSB1 bacterium]|nr:hypothetical protein [candidate division KSB1 bacterium]
MKGKRMKQILIIFIVTSMGWSQTPDVSFPPVGKIQPRHANDIDGNTWSVGAETMDRDYTIYENWKDYLGPLGFKHARIQSGWMKTEPEKGVYDFTWLDEIIFDMHEQGVKPWVNLAWSNKHYAEWTANNRGRVPKTEEGLKAWAQFVQALVARYGHIVDEWEIWNEASPGKIKDPADYVKLVQVTIPAIRSLQPDATIMLFALDHTSFKSIRPQRILNHQDTPFQHSDDRESVSKEVWSYLHDPERLQRNFDYVTFVMDSLKSLGLLDQIDVISYHPYEYNPDDAYQNLAWLREWAAEYAPHLTLYQGENGAPSERIEHRGLRGYEWTETTQAKWALRRLLGDLGRDIPSSYFGIMDMFYQEDVNRKGLLYANPDKTVHHKKKSYHALQNMAAIFDNRLQRIEHYPSQFQELPLSLFGYENKYSYNQIVTLWLHDQVPQESNEKIDIDLTLFEGRFDDPVYVDLLTGEVFDIPEKNWQKRGTVYEFSDIPVYDSPVLIAEKSLLPL